MRSSEKQHPSLQRRPNRTLRSTDLLPKPTTYPTSIKGVLVVEGRDLLVKNSRDEWELPGGRPEEGEEHAQTLAREFMEELSIKISMSAPLIHTFLRSFLVVMFSLSPMAVNSSVNFSLS